MKKIICSILISTSIFASILPVRAEIVDPDKLASDGKTVELVSKGKTAWRANDNSSLSGWTNGIEENDPQMGANNWLKGYNSNDYGIVDLGKPYSIAAAGVMSTATWYHFAPLDIYGTNDSACRIDGAELLATITRAEAEGVTPIGANADVKKAVAAANGSKYRYILFVPQVPANDGILAKEAYVYAYIADEYGEWTIGDNQGERSFELPVTYVNPSETKNYDIYAASYNADGYMTNYDKQQTGGSPLKASLTASAEDTKSMAVLFKDDMPVADAALGFYGFSGFNADIGTADSIDNAVSVYKGDDYSLVSVKSIAADDTIVVKSVKSDSPIPESAFMNAQKLYWYGAARSGNGSSFKIPFSEDGSYYISIERYTKKGGYEVRYAKYEMIDSQKRQESIDSFMDFVPDGANTLSDCIANAVDTLGFISADSLIDRNAAQTAEFAVLFADIRDILADVDVNTDELINMLNTTAVAYFLKNGDNSCMSEHGSLVTGNADVKDYVEKQLGYSFDADVKAEFDLQTPVTNIGCDGRLNFKFTVEMDKDTLTAKNIKLFKNGTEIDYDILFADSSMFSVDKSILETGAGYKISFNAGCLTKDQKKMSEVKSFEFKAGTIINAPYREGKIIKNVTLNKTVTGAVDTSWSNKPANTVTDGDTTGIVLFKAGETIKVDLGDYYEICALIFRGDDPSMGRWYHNTGVAVIGSDISSEFKDGEYSILFTYASAQAEVKTQVDCVQKPASAGLVKYLALKTSNPSGILMREIEAYAYADTEFGLWETEAFNGAGNYTFSIPVTENVSSNAYVMVISAYDENGKTLKTFSSAVSVQNGKLSASIDAPNGCAGISAAVVSDVKTMKALTDSITIGKSIETESEPAQGFSVAADNSDVLVNIALSDKIKKSSRAVVIAVKTTDTGKTAENAYAEMTAASVSQNTAYMYTGKSGDGIRLCLDNLEEGKYYINAAVTSLDGSVQNVYYKHTVVSETTRQNKIAEFMNADKSEIKNIINDVLNVSEVISSDSIADLNAVNDEEYLTLLLFTRDLMYTESEKAEEKNISSIVNVINAAAFVNAMYNADTQKAKELSSYASVLGEYYDADSDAAKLTAVFAQIKDNVNSSAALGEVLEWSKLLSFMNNASIADIAKAMRTYETELGIDINYAAQNGVSVERAAEFMNFTNLKTLVGKTAFNNAYQAAVMDAAAYNGGGSSSGGSSSSSIPVTGGSGVGVWTGPIQNEESTGSQYGTDASPAFPDMAGYEWADDAVKALKKKDIINGTEHGTFEPGRYVTRAEMVKMLVMAADVRVDESVYMSFIDVSEGSWYYPYIRIAFSRNICNGVSDYYFNPNGYITRQDMAVLADNFMKAVGIGADGEGKEFADLETAAEYARDSIVSAAKNGIINGFNDGSFKPLECTRRAEAAMVIYKLTAMIK